MSFSPVTPDQAMQAAAALCVTRDDAACADVYDAIYQSDNILLVLEEREGTLLIAQASQTLSAATGYTLEQLVGQPLTWLAAADNRPGVLEGLLAAVREGRAHRAELLCRTCSSRTFWFGLHQMPIRRHGRRAVILGHDITNKLLDQQQEKAAQSLLAKVFSTVDAPVYIMDLQGRYVMTNPALDRLIGVPPGCLVGSHVLDRYAPSCHGAVQAARAKQNEDHLDYCVDVILLRQGGGEIPCQITVVMVQRHDLLRFRIVTIRAGAAAFTSASPVITAAGRIQLIGMEEVRLSLGARWEALKTRAMATAEAVLRRHLAPADTFAATDDSGYVVCFVGLNEEEATFRAAAIGQAIRERLIGRGESAEVAHVFSAATALAPGEGERSGAELGAIVRERIEARLREVQARAREGLAEAMATAGFEADPVYSRAKTGPSGWCVRHMPAKQRAIDVALSVLPRAETEQFDPDVMLLELGQECALEHALMSPESLVFMTLSAEALLLRRRTEALLQACRSISEQLRQRLVLMVAVPPDGMSVQFKDALPRLRPFCRLLGLAFETLEAANVDDLAGASIVLLVPPPSASRTKLKALASTLQTRRVRLMFGPVERRDVAGLLADGASFVAMPAPLTARADLSP